MKKVSFITNQFHFRFTVCNRENENAKSTRYFVEFQMIFYEISYHSENIKDGNKTKKLFFLITKEQVLIVSVEP